ncbi:MAG: C1 family peptidase [Ferruginibacter sp.]
MQKKLLFAIQFVFATTLYAQQLPAGFTLIKNNAALPVKNQGMSGTCWCFSSTSLTESELLHNYNNNLELSEAFTVWNLYIDKAEKYIRRRGNARFSEGGLEQDVFYAIDNYGAMPETIYPGIGRDTILNHDEEMHGKLQAYLDTLLKNYPDTIPLNWKDGYKKILSSYLGTPPSNFIYNGNAYTPITFAQAYVKIHLDDFSGFTSFTHHPFYASFVMEVPDNYNDNMYYNLPLDSLIAITRKSVLNGYTISWDADVSNNGFIFEKGFAMLLQKNNDDINVPQITEAPYNQQIRQTLFDKQVTQDDHLMQITGLAKDANGKKFFIVKNSWGTSNPCAGYMLVSIPYFAINTISVLVDKNAIKY